MYNYKTIVLSGPPVSGKSTLANALARKYKFSLHSVGQMWRKKWRTLHPKGDVPFELFWSEAQETLTDKEKKALDTHTKEVCEQGNVIVDSRFVAIYGGDVGLRILVTADFEVRYLRAYERESYKSKSFEELKSILQNREKEEVIFGKYLYGQDYRDPTHYHIVLNSGMLTLEEEINVVDRLMKGH
jgi:cytidylate kinase